MVKLSYKFKLKASFEQVWRYFATFQNIAQYDPCVKTASLLSQGIKDNIGRKYDITTYVNGKESKMIYQVIQQIKNQGKFRDYTIKLYGSNNKLQSTDIIKLKQIGENNSNYNLLFQYNADICFLGIYWFITPFALSALQEVATNAQKGARKKCLQKWGLDCIQS